MRTLGRLSAIVLPALIASTQLGIAAPASTAQPVANGSRIAVTILHPRGVPQAAQRAPMALAAPAAASSAPLAITTITRSADDRRLPLWTYDLTSPRDGLRYQGAIVGRSPFNNSGTSHVSTYIVPLKIRTHRVSTTPLDFTTGTFEVAPGDTTVDPAAPDSCLQAPNNTITRVIRQSPLFSSTQWASGGTRLGSTQFLDALQRATFWNVLGGRADQYHVLLDQTTLPSVTVDVPADLGVAIVDPYFWGANFPPICGTVQLVDATWLDNYLTGTVIPSLQNQGVDPSAFPVFVTSDAYFAFGDVTFLGNCCAGGYHGLAGAPYPTQSYGVAGFDRSGFFSADSTPSDIDILSHEVAEWGNDPLVFNATPSWGHTGQVFGCQANLEVGDPLTGTEMAPVTMRNGFTYHMQDEAFFSWFFGGAPTGANGWHSFAGNFTTDAGPWCN